MVDINAFLITGTIQETSLEDEMKRRLSLLTIAGILVLVGCSSPNDPTIQTNTTTYAITVTQSGAASGDSLSADGLTITPEAISSDGGTASFTMPGAAVTVVATFSTIPPAIGTRETTTVGSSSLAMIMANNVSSITFPTGELDNSTATLTQMFWISETEVTNAVMAEVLQWAYDNGRFSTTSGSHNLLERFTIKHGGQSLLDLGDVNCHIKYDTYGNFTVEAGYENHPVTNVTWYGAIMFCNWLTEMRDGTTNNVVYTTIDTDWIDDETTDNTTRTGYRLPSINEWEYAARYRGTDSVNTVSGYSNPYFTRGNSASGATGDYLNISACQAVAVHKNSSPVPTDEAAVKSLGTGSANALGLYDMSGNVWEWCFDDVATEYRRYRGAGWDSYGGYLRIGLYGNSRANSEQYDLGFRLCRTAD